MLIFFAGSAAFEKNYQRLQPLVRNRLISYHYRAKSLEAFYLEPERSPHIENLMMDSGAFSAWSNGAEINLDEYIEYCLKYIDAISYVVNLDVIPARPGQKKIPQEEIERSAQQGWKNAQKMLRAGIPKEKLIHVFHQNENFHWLERMVREFDYIGLSPANDRTTLEKQTWLDSCMPYVTDSKGFPTIKFHGFAVTALNLMLRFPWFSVDSATWAQQAGRGAIYIPQKKQGKERFDVLPHLVRIGHNSPFERTADHFTNLPPQQKQEFLDYFAMNEVPLGRSSCVRVEQKKGGRAPIRFCREREDCDFINRLPSQICQDVIEEEGLINKMNPRAYINALFLNNLQEAMPPWPTKPFRETVEMTNGFNIL
jgi:hypothetical protein